MAVFYCSWMGWQLAGQLAFVLLTYQETALPDSQYPNGVVMRQPGVTRDQFPELWKARYRKLDREWEGPELLSYEIHNWKFSAEFIQQYPNTAALLRRSSTFDVTVQFRFGGTAKLMAVFWRAEDGEILSWVLIPPIGDIDAAVKWEAPVSLKVLWSHFRGFRSTLTLDLKNNDLPPAAYIFDSWMEGPGNRLGQGKYDLFVEFCDDKDFRRRIPRMRYLADDVSGNYLVVEEDTGLVFFLSRDEDLLGQYGVRTEAIGETSPCVYIIKGGETPEKLVEMAAQYVLDKLPPLKSPPEP